MRRFMGWFLSVALLVAIGYGCSGSEQEADSGSIGMQGSEGSEHEGSMGAQGSMGSMGAQGSMGMHAAMCELSPTEGNTVNGTVMFTQVEGGVKVTAVVMGLTPGNHGFHVHETGDCSAPDATSAGGHFNPDQMAHGGPDAEVRHEGDLGNLVADSTGTAHYERVDAHLALEGENSIIGRAVIVHAKVDDLTSQPTGAAGARVACGVIGAGTE